MSRIPDALRADLPDELADAEIAGIDTADVDEDVRLWGPPGTGKSTQSALRTATRAFEEGIYPSEMTVVTYRKALAGVVRERLLEWGMFDEDDEFKYWTTIHAAASRATGFHDRFGDNEGLEGMVGSRAEYRFCKKLEISKRPSKPWYETRWTVFRDLYNYAKNNLLDVGSYAHVPDEWLRDVSSSPVAARKLKAFRREWGTETSFETVARKWEEFKDYHNCYDFFEQLTAALSGSLPPMKHVVIDEYHDATPLMSAVTERWVRNAETVIVAGDPDQVVNAYAGANPGFFEQLSERTDREVPVVKLDRSYRCPDEHFAAAARVLASERSPPDLATAGVGALNRWPAWEFSEDGDEWNTPAPEQEGSPAYLVDEFGEDMMFLARTRRQVAGVAAALDEAGVVYRSQPGVGGDWETRLALLNALDLIEDATAPTEAEGGALSGRTGGDLSKYALTAEQARLLRKHSHGRYLTRDEAWRKYIGDLDDDERVSLRDLREFVTDRWYLRYGQGAGSVPKLTQLSDIDKIAMLSAWERYDLPESVEDADTRVLTIHASKGTEASNVVVYDGITDSIADGMEQSPELRENEARTWYVALTRASERLHIIRGAFGYDTYLPADLEPWAASAAEEVRGDADV
jgi:DNA helicase-2/ATP-dependent DNA helicase PcrA